MMTTTGADRLAAKSEQSNDKLVHVGPASQIAKAVAMLPRLQLGSRDRLFLCAHNWPEIAFPENVSSPDADSVQINLGVLGIPCYDSPAWGKGRFSFQPVPRCCVGRRTELNQDAVRVKHYETIEIAVPWRSLVGGVWHVSAGHECNGK
jgi:hypothetical protein